MLHQNERERWRWEHADGRALALTTLGRLVSYQGPTTLEPVQVEAPCTFEGALVYAQARGFRQVPVGEPGPVPAPDAPGCRHCNRTKVNRPRGLCWSCYYAPGVRDLYPSTSKFAKRGVPDFNGRAREPAPATRSPGDVEVLEARAVAGESLFHPDDEVLPMPAADRLREIARALGPDASYLQVAAHAREDGLEITEEEWLQARQSLRLTTDRERRAALRGPAKPQPAPQPQEEPTMTQTNGTAHALNNHKKGRRVREVLQDLGPDTTHEQLLERLTAEGLSCSNGSFYVARRALWPEVARKPGRPDGRPAPKPQPRPDGPPRAEPAIAAAPPPPAPASQGPATVSLLRGFLAAVRAVGGPAAARELLDALQEG
jgi:hypothetical protein